MQHDTTPEQAGKSSHSPPAVAKLKTPHKPLPVCGVFFFGYMAMRRKSAKLRNLDQLDIPAKYHKDAWHDDLSKEAFFAEIEWRKKLRNAGVHVTNIGQQKGPKGVRKQMRLRTPTKPKG